MENKWKTIKDFVNSHSFFTKKDLVEKYNIEVCQTMAQYILLMMNSRFLKRVSRGSYQRIMIIPENVTVSKLKILAYNEEERSKYDRKTKLKHLNNIK